jgi:hypothetical protein
LAAVAFRRSERIDSYFPGDGYPCKDRACATALKEGGYVHFVSNSMNENFYFGNVGDCISKGVPEISSEHGSLPGVP